jgi:hypothetical protein
MTVYKWLDNFYETYNPKKVMHDVSGGADSAIGFYIHCKYVTDNKLNTEFYTYSDYPTTMKNTILPIKLVISYMKEEFNNIVFGVNSIYELDYNKDFMHQRRSLIEATKRIYDIHAPHISGVTMSPDVQTQLDNGMDPNRWPNRLVSNPKSGRIFYNMNKKDIKNLYDEYDIMDLFPLTLSCIYGLNPCMNCWPCKERQWAFGN